MNKLVLAALGAAAISAPAFAQGHEGHDMTRQDAQAMADAMFQRFDLNHDGVVTRDEAQQALAQFTQGGAGPRAAKAEKMIDRVFGASQSVTKEQFEAMSLAKFDREDVNHDGIVTDAERHAHRTHDQKEAQ